MKGILYSNKSFKKLLRRQVWRLGLPGVRSMLIGIRDESKKISKRMGRLNYFADSEAWSVLAEWIDRAYRNAKWR